MATESIALDDSLFEEQKSLGVQIDKFRINYTKDREARKKDVPYFENKRTILKEFFEEFEGNHKAIEMEYQDRVQDHEYFTNNYFDQIHAMYLDLLSKISIDRKAFLEKMKEKLPVVSELGEVLSKRAFNKRMIELLAVRFQKGLQLDEETWKFNLERVERYWSSYKQCVEMIIEKYNSDYENLKLQEEIIVMQDLYQEMVVSVEDKLARLELAATS